MDHSEPRKIRKSLEELHAYLDALDRQAVSAADRNARQAERHRYRVFMTRVELESQQGGMQVHQVPTRNLSRLGVSFLIGHYVYPGTASRIELRTVAETTQPVTGRIVHCRYLTGSGTVYEVGVRFGVPIEMALFQPEAKMTKVLLIAEDPVALRHFQNLLKGRDVEITYVDGGELAVAALEESGFDAVLLDLSSENGSGEAIARRVREAGYHGTLIGYATEVSADVRGRAFEAGCTQVAPATVTRDVLMRMLTEPRAEPASGPGEGEELLPAIDAFVGELSAHMETLSTALETSNFDTLARAARLLKGQAGTLGLPVITEVAARIEASIQSQASVDELRGQLDELGRACAAAQPSAEGGDEFTP